MGSDQIGIGILGATGYIGTIYRRELRSCTGARIVGLAARRKSLLEEAKEEDSALLATENWQEVVEHPDVDLVIVATPDAYHQEQALHCAKSNKHLFCEKPIGMNLAQAKAIFEAYQNLDRFTFVPFWTRYSPPFVRAKQLVDSGRLGDIRAVIYRWHNPRPRDVPKTWRDDLELSSAGSLADIGSHAYDTIRWLLKEDACRVLVHSEITTATKRDLGEINLSEALHAADSVVATTSDVTAPDYSSINFEFASGRLGVAIVSHASFLRRGISPELEIHGEEASLSLNRVSGDLLIAENQGQPQILANIPDVPCNRFERYVIPSLRDYLADCARESKCGSTAHHDDLVSKYPNLNDGLQVQSFVESAIASNDQGTWAELSQVAEQ